jgi:hypothetical protein
VTDPEPNASAAETESTQSAALAQVADQLRGVAGETAALVAAVGRLASAEAALSLTALTRTVGLRLIGALLLTFGVVAMSVAGTIVLAHWLGSTAAALAAIGLFLTLAAAAALWRARIWGARIGFVETRAALGASPPPPTEPKP